MEDFVIDTKGSQERSSNEICEKHDSFSDESGEDEEEKINYIPLNDMLDFSSEEDERKKKSKSKCDISLENTYLTTNYCTEGINKNVKSHVDELMKKSVIQPGFEKQISVPVRKSKRALKRERKLLRDKTKGQDWYNLPATEVTEEIQNDLDILKMRCALDSKHVYKKNDITVTPKYFQVGRIVEGPAEFYNARIPKSQRKKTLVDELLADSNFRAYQKKKFKEIISKNRRKKAHKVVFKKKNLKKNLKDEWLSWD